MFGEREGSKKVKWESQGSRIEERGRKESKVCWQQVWGRDWVKSAENKADDVRDSPVLRG
jgi:hypothetical protein